MLNPCICHLSFLLINLQVITLPAVQRMNQRWEANESIVKVIKAGDVDFVVDVGVRTGMTSLKQLNRTGITK